ncbi:MAG: restriction endonuclease subunit S, partial [Ruminococcus sp.]|nr:restriction endonuclease subunit S [Ruminococcus sp.]
MRIGDVVNYEQPTKYIVKSTDYNDNFDIPVLTAGQTFILGYTNEKDNIYQATEENPIIIFDDFTGAFKWVDFPFKVKSSAVKMLKADNKKTLMRYIFHVMGYIGFTSSEHKRLWIGIYSDFQIPLPPIEIQHEIVRIL